MNKLLITGCSGFVGRCYMDYLCEQKKEIQVVGMDVYSPNYAMEYFEELLKFKFYNVDMLDEDRVFELIEREQPNYILHLASYSSVAYSWEYPNESFMNNTNIFLNLISAVRKAGIKPRILSVGSSEEYGNVEKSNMPVCESEKLRPLSPYAIARVSQEMLSKVFVDSFGMDIVMTRSFNHIGRYQNTRFAIPYFAARMIELKERETLEERILEVGDLSVVRDFIDVRDVVSAYSILFEKGISGEIYNVCSGKGYVLEDVIHMLMKKLQVDIKIEKKPSRVRPNDIPVMIGCSQKLEALGWEKKYNIEDSLTNLIDYLENKAE